MGLYDRHVLPHLIDFACGMGTVMKARSQIVPLAKGRVLEIGIGTGLNLSFYDPQRVDLVVGVDPSADMQHLARDRAARCQVPVEMIARPAGGALATSPHPVVETAGRRLPPGPRHTRTDRGRRLSYPPAGYRLPEGTQTHDPRLSRLGRLSAATVQGVPG